ncbi:hypothetical protein AVEN_134764-1, partial [Araneus ventricosus]
GLIAVFPPYLPMPRGRGDLVVRSRRRSQRVRNQTPLKIHKKWMPTRVSSSGRG